MSFQAASKELSRDKQFTSMTLIGGYDCDPNNPRKGIDLRVKGGALIEKSFCVLGNINVAGILSGQINGNLLTDKIQETELMQGIQVCGNLLLDENSSLIGNICVPSGGSVNIKGDLTTTNNVTMTLPIYTDNASALVGGLSIGMLYRTGGDPDLVCIVH